jgi:hypothetical protein
MVFERQAEISIWEVPASRPQADYFSKSAGTIRYDRAGCDSVLNAGDLVITNAPPLMGRQRSKAARVQPWALLGQVHSRPAPLGCRSLPINRESRSFERAWLAAPCGLPIRCAEQATVLCRGPRRSALPELRTGKLPDSQGTVREASLAQPTAPPRVSSDDHPLLASKAATFPRHRCGGGRSPHLRRSVAHHRYSPSR